MPSHVAVAMGSGDGKVFGIGMEGAEMDNRPQVHAESRSIMKGRTRRFRRHTLNRIGLCAFASRRNSISWVPSPEKSGGSGDRSNSEVKYAPSTVSPEAVRLPWMRMLNTTDDSGELWHRSAVVLRLSEGCERNGLAPAHLACLV